MSEENEVAGVWHRYWNKAKDYSEHPSIAWDLMDDDKTSYFLQHVDNRRGLLLEVGCGTARMSVRLAKKGFGTVCLDHSISVLPLASQNYLKNDLKMIGLAGDGYRLPFADNTFDGVLSTGLLEHFEDPRPLLNEMVRVAKKTGLFMRIYCPGKNGGYFFYLILSDPCLAGILMTCRKCLFGEVTSRSS